MGDAVNVASKRSHIENASTDESSEFKVGRVHREITHEGKFIFGA